MDFIGRINLAPFKYRNILAPNGPIARVEYHRNTLIDDTEVFSVNCWLAPELRGNSSRLLSIYGDSDGSGTSKSRIVAFYKAVSEALERWAFYSTIEDVAQREKYGFEVDSTTGGMAAFPGLTCYSAERNAFFESVERWALIQWWNGLLISNVIPEMSTDSVKFYSIKVPFDGVYVVLICHKFRSDKLDFYAYGFSCGPNIRSAFEQALVEASRNKDILIYAQSAGLNIRPADLASIQEQRLIYFSTFEGHECFLNRIQEGTRLVDGLAAPKPLIKAEIRGPWSKYVSVCRCLFPTNSHVSHSKLKTFHF